MIGLIALGLLQTQYRNPVLYEINERAFSATGDFAGIESRLDNIKRLGVTTIWLMPINPVGKLKSAGGLGSPYSIQDYTKVNPEFGSMHEFNHLVDSAHARGMKIVIDWVADHTSWDSPWIKNKDWYQQDAQGNITIPKGTNYLDTAGLNFNSAPMRQEMIKEMEYWVDHSAVDGFRCDYANAVPVDFWKQAITDLRKKSPRPLLMLAEGDKPGLIEAGFDLTYDWQSYDWAKKAFHSQVNPRDFSKHVTSDAKTLLRFVSNHDEAAWNGSAVDQFGGKDAAFGAFLTTCLTAGTPLIYDGQEIGWQPKIPFFDRSRIDWNSGITQNRRFERVMSLYQTVTGSAESYAGGQALVFSRPAGQKTFWIVTNPTSDPIEATLPYILGQVHDVVSDQNLALTDHVRLNPYQSLVFLSPQTD